jgi:hypothetical protein
LDVEVEEVSIETNRKPAAEEAPDEANQIATRKFRYLA